jgi:hypothetical protein
METEQINAPADPKPVPEQVITMAHVIAEMNSQRELVDALKKSIALSLDGSTMSAERQAQIDNVFAVLRENRMRLGNALSVSKPKAFPVSETGSTVGTAPAGVTAVETTGVNQ